MKFLLLFLGGFIGAATVIAVIAFVLYRWFYKALGGRRGMSEFKDAMKNAVQSEKDAYSNPKSLTGMTDILVPSIQRDFNDFNTDLLFTKVESGLKSVFRYITDQDTENLEKDKSLLYVRNSVRKEIEDMRVNQTFETFNNVRIHKTVIKEYKKKNGAATIVCESSVSYKYDTNRKGKKVYKDVVKSTRYLTEIVYVYDESKFNSGVYNFGVNCPNCGAPSEKLGGHGCSWCGTFIEPINLKNWFMASYKEK